MIKTFRTPFPTSQANMIFNTVETNYFIISNPSSYIIQDTLDLKVLQKCNTAGFVIQYKQKLFAY